MNSSTTTEFTDLPPAPRSGGGTVSVLVLVGCVFSGLTACSSAVDSAGPPTGTGGISGQSGGGSGSGGAGGGESVPACDAPTKYFKRVDGDGCGNVLCHGAGGGDPDLATGTADEIWRRLYNQPNVLSPLCGDMKLVGTGKPADGVLLRRLKTMDCSPITMPKDVAFPDQPAIDCISSWVNSKLP